MPRTIAWSLGSTRDLWRGYQADNGLGPIAEPERFSRYNNVWCSGRKRSNAVRPATETLSPSERRCAVERYVYLRKSAIAPQMPQVMAFAHERQLEYSCERLMSIIKRFT